MATTMFYPTPTVDVDVPTMAQILAARPDITNAYTNQVRSDGSLWITNGVPDVPGIITDWWTHVAGFNDAPRLYGNSLAEWARVNLHLPVTSPSAGGSGSDGTTPINQPIASTSTPVPSYTGAGGYISAKTAAVGMGIMLLFFFALGGRRADRMQFRKLPSYYGNDSGGGVVAGSSKFKTR